jgi:hypothetical protein
VYNGTAWELATVLDIYATELTLTSAALSPAVNDGTALGTSSLQWSDLHLASGAVIDFNGDMTITHANDVLTFAGGTVDLPNASRFLRTSGSEGGEMRLQVPASGTTINGDIVVDVAGDQLRFFESGSPNKGAFISLPHCPDSVQGQLAPIQFTSLTASRALTNSVAVQAIFAAADDTLTVRASTTYFFQALLHISAMSATSGNFQFSLVGGGTATLTSVKYISTGGDAAVATVGAQGGQVVAASASSANVVPAGTATGAYAFIRGIFRVNAAGTIIPSIALQTAAAAQMEVNSYFACWPMASNTAAQNGAWS